MIATQLCRFSPDIIILFFLGGGKKKCHTVLEKWTFCHKSNESTDTLLPQLLDRIIQMNASPSPVQILHIQFTIKWCIYNFDNSKGYWHSYNRLRSTRFIQMLRAMIWAGWREMNISFESMLLLQNILWYHKTIPSWTVLLLLSFFIILLNWYFWTIHNESQTISNTTTNTNCMNWSCQLIWWRHNSLILCFFFSRHIVN